MPLKAPITDCLRAARRITETLASWVPRGRPPLGPDSAPEPPLGSGEASEESPADLLARTERLFQEGRFAQAESDLERLTRQSPDSPAGFVGLALAAQMQGDRARALTRWEACERRFPQRELVTWALGTGRALLKLGDPEAAEGHPRQARARWPDDLAALQGLIEAACARGDPRSGVALREALQAATPGTFDNTMRRGAQLAELGRHEEADVLSMRLRTVEENGIGELDAQSKGQQRLWTAGLRIPAQSPSHRRYNLTIGAQPRFIWFRNAKVATRSTLKFLDEAGVRFDARQVFGCYYPPSCYSDHYKFAFVRNPWDRLVSGWLDKVARPRAHPIPFAAQLKSGATFRDFVEHCASADLDTCDHHFRRQCRLIDLNHIDFIGRLEHYEDDLVEVARTLGLPVSSIPRKNVSESRQQYRAYYDEDTRELVARLYSVDIQMFGYSF
jgi:hypothetical protein